MASGTGSLVDWGVAWDGRGQRDDVPSMLLELFDRVNHDGGIVLRLLMGLMIFQALFNVQLMIKE